MLSNPRPPKSQRGLEGVNNSNTLLDLPGIVKLGKYPSTERKPLKLSYIQTIRSIFERGESEDKNPPSLATQQSKLKEVLRKMNSDSHHIIQAIKPKNNLVKIVGEESVLIDRQIENSKKSIEMMLVQKAKLQQKFTKIVYPKHLQEVLIKIDQVSKQIEEIRTANAQMRSTIQKSSFKIVKQQSQGHDLRWEYLQSEKALLDQKLQRMKNDNSRTVEQTIKIQEKTKEVQGKIKEHQLQYQNVKSISLQQVNNRNKELGYAERKSHLGFIKKKMEVHNNNLQYRHTRLAKELQTKRTVCLQLAARQKDLNEKIGKSKEEIEVLQIQMGVVKQ